MTFPVQGGGAAESVGIDQSQGGPGEQGAGKLPEYMIVDNFYENPWAVRQEALASRYRQPEAPYPLYQATHGSVSASLALTRIAALIGETLYDTEMPIRETNVGRFQLGLAAATPIICIHSDPFMWVAEVFLHPEPPPDAGLCFYRHIASGRTRRENDPDRSDLTSNVPLSIVYPHQFDQFEVWQTVENRFNRLVIFDASLFHAPARYFGDSGESGRLIQTLFFNLGRSYRGSQPLTAAKAGV